MPIAPTNQKCSQLGCKNPRSRYSSLCIEHGGRDKQRTYTDKERLAFNSMYGSRQWRALRIAELSRHPLCASCLVRGVVTQATELDHVFPWRSLGKEAFYRNRFQCLCHDCHAMKTQAEKRGTLWWWHDGAQHEHTLDDWSRMTLT